jgi:hypothetical protein
MSAIVKEKKTSGDLKQLKLFDLKGDNLRANYFIVFRNFFHQRLWPQMMH